MSTHTQNAHWYYTIEEWRRQKQQKYLDIIFQNNDIHIIYDIGANTGATAYTFLEYAKNNGKKIHKIYCYEPDNENMDYLRNKLKNEIETGLVESVNKGIYYGKTSAKVYGAGSVEEGKIHANVGGYSIDECMEEIIKIRNSNGENVFCAQVGEKIFELDTLENLSKGFLQPDFIKIDVEGAEKNIMMNSTLIKNAKYIIVEWNQNICMNTFLQQYLPNFKVISCEWDILLKNIY